MLKNIALLGIIFLLHASNFWSQDSTITGLKDVFTSIIVKDQKESALVKWTLDCNDMPILYRDNASLVVRYITEPNLKLIKNGAKDVKWTYSELISLDSSKYIIENLEGDMKYAIQVGFTQSDITVKVDESSVIGWSENSSASPSSGWNTLKFFILIGALGFFIFGMKTMSEGIQKVAGQKLRNLLNAATTNRFAGVLTGFTTTSIIQSSSATTVMVVSFVNAGLLNLRQAIGVIMGANIGTTVTSFLILVFAFGKVSISDYSFPIIAIAMPMLFFSSSTIKSLGEFLMGFAMLFMGLDAMKEVMSFIKEDPRFLIEIVTPLTSYGFLSVLLFVAIGTLLTVIVQSSSAAMSITLTLCGTDGIPLEYGAAIILGENIGTTITANLAAMVGNIHARRAARVHLLFNLIGVVWMLAVFYSFLSMIGYLIQDTFFHKLVTEGDKTSEIQWSLAIYHLIFNLINTFVLIWFVGGLEKLAVKLVPSRTDADEEFNLDFIGGPMGSTAELCILEAKKEVTKFGNVTARMSKFVKTVINSSDKKEKKKFLKKISKYEEITDRVEEEVIHYIGKVTQMEMSANTSQQTRAMLSIAHDLERIGDIYFQISKSLEKKEDEQAWFTPEQRDGVNLLIDKVDVAFEIMNTNLAKTYGTISLEPAIEARKDINKTRKILKRKHMESMKDGEFNIKTVLIYNDLLHALDKVGDHIISVNEAISGQNLV